MTKTQQTIVQLEKQQQQLHGIKKYLMGFKILFLEIGVILQKLFFGLFHSKRETFEKFSRRDAFGNFQDSYTAHERFHATAIAAFVVVSFFSVAYAVTGALPFSPEIREQRVLGVSTFTVNSNASAGDGVCDGSCTLRDAILSANGSAGQDDILFTAGMTIDLAAPLPAITEAVFIDGDTDDDGVPDVIVNGSGAGAGDGITLTSDDNTVSGLVIQNFTGNGITITGSNNTIAGNYIGTNSAGTAAASNSGDGIAIVDDGTASDANTIGGSSANDRNLISGNTGNGISLADNLVQNTVIEGNTIGATLAGTAPLANDYGVYVSASANNNTIGGTVSGTSCSSPCNLISGNTTAEIRIDGAAHDNDVQGNVLGLNIGMTKPIEWNHDGAGVSIAGGAYANVVGGNRNENASEIGQGNVIGGFADDFDNDISFTGAGIDIEDDGFDAGTTTGNSVFGNLIGLNASGITSDAFNNATGAAGADSINDLRNNFGVHTLADFTVVGDGTSAHRNAITGNLVGIAIDADSGVDSVVIRGNYIGTDKTGESAQTSPGYYGEHVSFYEGARISGTDILTVRENVFSGFPNITLSGHGAYATALFFGNRDATSPTGDNTRATIIGNKFGTDKDGLSGISNYTSIACEELSDSIIGGSDSSDRNILSSSGQSSSGGPIVSSPLFGEQGGCHDVQIENNYFGTDITGNTALRNPSSVDLDYAEDLVVVDNLFGDFEGSAVTMDFADGIQLTGNTVTLGANGTTVFHNEGMGSVHVEHTANLTVDDNVFVGAHGLSLDGTHDSSVTNNFFGTDATETNDFDMFEGISVFNSWDITVTGNVIKNGNGGPLYRYLVANTPFHYAGNDYDQLLGTNGYVCDTGQTGLQTLFYNGSLGLLSYGSICGNTQSFSGMTYIPSYESLLNPSIQVGLITKAGLHYAILVSQSSGGPFTCAALATAYGGTCDKTFTLFNLSGTDYVAAALPGDVSLVDESVAPSVNKYKFPSGISVMGGNGGVVVNDNTITENGEPGITVIGGHDNTLDNNVITNNTEDGIDVQESTGNVITNNEVTDNGDNGIALMLSVDNTVGNVTTGNTVSGHGVNGILISDSSDSNTVSSNSVTNNGPDSAGAGITVDESSDNAVYDNTVTDNGTGIQVVSTDNDASGNVVGGVAINQANTIETNDRDGILLRGYFTQDNTVAGNTVSTNGRYGLNNVLTHSTDNPTPVDGDNLVGSNVFADNTSSGIRNLGASPKIVSNISIANDGHGILNVVDYGSSTSPSTESDDTLSEPIIGGDGIDNTIEGNALYGIYSLDTASENKSTLADDNTFDDTNLSGRIRQDWYGLVYTELNGDPDEGAEVKVYGDGQSDPFVEFATAASGFGPSDADVNDVESWEVIPELVVSPTGTAQNYSPHLVIATGSSGTTSFSFDGVNPTDTGDFGNINGRYQVATVQMALLGDTIQGTVYNDVDGSATRGDELGLADVPVTVYRNDDADNDFLDENDSVIDTVTTDADGFYAVNDLSPGNYFVKVNEPSGYNVTTPNPSEKIHFDAEDQLVQQDFGLHQDESQEFALIHGKVFNDADGDGTIDESEKGIRAYAVRLYTDTNADKKLDDADKLLITTSTDVNGDYSFTDVDRGGYFVTLSVNAKRVLTTNNNPSFVEITGENTNDDFAYNFGLKNQDSVLPPDDTTPPPDDTTPPIAPHTGGTPIGLVSPHTGASTANSMVAALALGLSVVNLILAAGSSLPNLLRLIFDLFTEPLLALFGVKKLPWGRAFDSLTKIPIDLGIVRLYDAKTKHLVATAVTDRTGRFKFLPRPGWYTAKAIKIGYAFPSSILSAAPVYEKQNLYFGDKFKIDDLHQTFNRDIPLDRAESKGDLKTLVKLRTKQALHMIFAFMGITISIVNMVILLSWFTFGLFILHILLLAFFWRLAMPKKPKSWGMVYDQETKKPLKDAVVRIYDQKFGRLLDVTVTDRNGKFGFLVGLSSYYLTAEAPGYDFPGTKKSMGNDYVGGEIKITEKDKSVSYNIPLKKK